MPDEAIVPVGTTQHRRAARSLTTALLLLALIVVWGSNYPLIKLALSESGPWTFNALRYAIAVLMLGGVLWARRGRRALVPVAGERLLMGVAGILQTAVITGGSTLAMTRIEAGRTVLIAYSMPIWSLAMSALLLHERVTLTALLGLALGLAGLALLSAPWAMDWTSASAVSGSVMALVGTLGWALGAVIYRSRPWATELWSQVFWQLLAGAVPLIAAALFVESTPFRPNALFWTIAVYNGLVPTVLGYWCWALLLNRLPATTVGQIIMLSPLFGVLVSALLLSEPLTATLLTSGLLIVGGAVLSYFRPAPANR